MEFPIVNFGFSKGFGFPIENFHWLSGGVPRFPLYEIYISQLVRFARCCTSVFDFHSKNLQITSKLLTQGYRYHKRLNVKTFGKFFRSYFELLSNFGAISFQDYVSQWLTHPVFYADPVYKLRSVKGEANFISSGSKIVKRLRRRQYDPAIIERTIGLVLGPFTALYRSFLKRCTLTNKAVWTIWRALTKLPHMRQGPDPRPLWLLVGTPLAFGPELAYRLRVAQPTLMDVTRYFWHTFILLYSKTCLNRYLSNPITWLFWYFFLAPKNFLYIHVINNLSKPKPVYSEYRYTFWVPMS